MARARNRLSQYFREPQSPPHGCPTGAQLGDQWAARLATIDELYCLEVFLLNLETTGQLPTWFCADPTDPFTLGERWHFAVIDPAGTNIRNRVPFDPNRTEAKTFWTSAGATPEQADRGDFLLSFSNAARLKWHDFQTGRKPQ